MKESKLFGNSSIEAYNEAFDNFKTYLLKRSFDVTWPDYSLISDILDAISEKAMVDHKYRLVAYRYFSGYKGYSTLKLRELTECVGYGYLSSLDTRNAINVIDTICHHYKLGIKTN